MVPRTVLTKSGLISLNTARPVNTVQPRTAVNTVKGTRVNTARPKAVLSVVKGNKGNAGNLQQDLQDKGVIDCGCSRHMTGNRSYLTDYEETLWRICCLWSVSQMCDKKNSVLFTDTECVVLSPDFKLTDESHVLLKVPRKDNMYSVDLKNVVPQGGLTCHFAKATPDESNLWNRRLGHVNFKTMNKMVRGNLVRGLPSKLFEINQTCVACQKGKQHKASCIENLIDLKVKVIRCDNGTEFKIRAMNQLCEMKGKFDGKADEGFFVGYTTNSKAFRVFNSRTRIVEDNMHVQFSENTTNIAGSRPNWLFDIDALTKSINYKPVVAGNQSNGSASTKACDNAGKARVETVPGKDYILLPLWTQDPPFSSSSKDSPDVGFKPSGEEEKKDVEDQGNEDSEVPSIEEPRVNQEKDANVNNTNNINTVSPIVNDVDIQDNVVDDNIVYGCADDPNMPELEEIMYSDDDEDVSAEADIKNLDTFMSVSPILTTRVHKDHPVEQIIRDLNSAPQTRRMTKKLEEHGFISILKQRTTHKDLQNCLFACFLSQEEPKKVVQALKDPSWIEAIQEELLQFKLQEVWTLMELPNGKRAIGTKWVIKNKKDERELKQLGYLAYASFKDFVVYHMDVKSAFLYGKIKEEVYVCQPSGFEDSDFPDRVYKVEKAIYGLHQVPKAWYETLSTYLLDNGFQRGKIDKTLFIRSVKGDILLVQVYVDDIIFGSIKKSLCIEFEKMMHKKFQMSSIASTPMETHKPLLKDTDGEDVDEQLYRSMIGSLMYLTSSRPDIMLAVCQPKLGLWYPKDLPFDLVAYTDSDYAGASLDRKSTTRGCQFLGCRLISWQCKKQTVVANSTTEAEYIAASNCCGQTKYIEIMHHFIRDSNKKKLIQMIKIHTDQNVADLLTKAFNVSRFQYLIASIGMLNL
ncbi:putative ribonuclease H-like domain-containing protein [Tanacetum coccineum]